MKIQIDLPSYEAAGIKFTRDSSIHGTFTLPDIATHHDSPLSVGVQIDGDYLWLFPLRSSGQRRLLSALNISAESATE